MVEWSGEVRKIIDPVGAVDGQNQQDCHPSSCHGACLTCDAANKGQRDCSNNDGCQEKDKPASAPNKLYVLHACSTLHVHDTPARCNTAVNRALQGKFVSCDLPLETQKSARLESGVAGVDSVAGKVIRAIRYAPGRAVSLAVVEPILES